MKRLHGADSKDAAVALALSALLLTAAAMHLFLNEGWWLRSFPLGRQDFSVFWRAARAFAAGGNAYTAQPAEITAQQQLFGLPFSEVNVFFSPPIIFSLLAPLFSLSFENAARVWIILNLGFVCVLPFTASRLSSCGRANDSALLLAALLFLPVWELIFYGQLSLFVLILAVSAFAAHRADKHFLCGLCLSAALIKPHIIYLALASLVLAALRTRKYSFFAGLCGGAAVLALYPLISRPQSFIEYLQVWSVPLNYRSLSVADSSAVFVQTWFASSGLRIVQVLFPLVLLTAVLWRQISRSIERFTYEQFVTLLGLSLLGAPYSRSYDKSILIVIHIAVVQRFFSAPGKQWRAFLGLAAIELLWLGRFMLEAEAGHWLSRGLEVSFPLLVMIVWFTSRSAGERAGNQRLL